MKFGFQLPTCIEGLYLNPFTVGPEELRKIAVRAEELGFDSVWANDHLAPWRARRQENNGQPLRWYEPLVTLSHCAAVTKRIKLALGVIVMPFREPVTLAAQAATLDVFSGGRLIFGLGIGGSRDEMEMLYPRRAKWNRSVMLDEALESFRLLFSGKQASFEGKYYNFQGVTLAQPPLQMPLPLFISGVSPSAMERVARYATGLMTMAANREVLQERIDGLRTAAERQGRDPATIDVAVSAVLCLDTTHEGALKQLTASWMGRRFLPGLRHAAVATATQAGRTTLEEFAGNHLIGTPEEVTEKVRQLARIGVTYIVPQHIAADTVSLHMEQMEMMGKGVLPLAG